MMSMTGVGQGESGGVLAMAKSVNGKGLEVRIRGVQDYMVESKITKLVRDQFMRGTIDIVVNSSARSAATRPDAVTTAAALDTWAAWLAEVSNASSLGLAEPKDSTWQRWLMDRALVSEAEETDVLKAVEIAITGLHKDCGREGEILSRELIRLCSQMTEVIDEVDSIRADEEALTLTKICEKMDAWRSRFAAVDSANESVAGSLEWPPELIAALVKGDIQEEIVRLRAHIAEIERICQEKNANEAIGRTLSVIGQELVREANTLTTKVQHIKSKKLGIALKTFTDQYKEQVANVA